MRVQLVSGGARSPPQAGTLHMHPAGSGPAGAVLVAHSQPAPRGTRPGLASRTLGVATPDQPRSPHWPHIAPPLVGLPPPPGPPADALAQVPAGLPLPPAHCLTDPLGDGKS